ncbi:MAG: SpoIIE family protein phosphatase [Phycisphaerae bacterium]|nr:SpoIIE family protein phosphatase [Phycisphaerae bacterium]
MPDLIIRHPDGRQTTVTLSRQPVRIGRGLECDIDLGATDAEVSRRHADIWLNDEGQVVVADLKSKNGTRIDGQGAFWDDTRVAYRSIQIGEHQIDIAGAPTRTGSTIAGPVEFGPDRPPNAGQLTVFPSSRGFQLSQERLSLLMKLSERISGASLDRRELLEQGLDTCFDTFGFERGLIVVKAPRGETEPPVTRNVQPEQISRTLINRALVDGQRTIVNDVETDLRGNISESLVRFPICSALCVPLVHRDEILGVIYGDRVTDTAARPYQAEDVDFLAAVAQQIGLGLANRRLFETHLRMQQLERELQRARDIQRQLLPAEPLQAGRVTIAGYNEPSEAVSGDYFDYFTLPDDRIGFVIADVVGHGLPAALLSTNLQAAANVALSGIDSLSHVVARINRLICRNTLPHAFITAILGMVDTRSGDITFVSAGHPGPLLVGQEFSEAIDCHGALPLGIDDEEEFDVLTLHPESHVKAIVFYTDGLIEAANGDGELLGLPEIKNTLATLREPTNKEIIRVLRGRVRKHLGRLDNEDDLTLLTMQLA